MEEGKDFYFIDGGYIVFTEEYHLKRGYCCKNNCRHCPWNKRLEKETIQTNQKKRDYRESI
jgi:hypothetical protein